MNRYFFLLAILFWGCQNEQKASDDKPLTVDSTHNSQAYSETTQTNTKDTLKRKLDTLKYQNWVHKWNDAHNASDTGRIGKMYCSYTFYYRKEVEIKEILKDKARFFAKNPDFQQEILGKVRVVSNGGSGAICYFNKKVTAGGKTQIYPSYLEFFEFDRGTEITTEGDSVTDILIRKRKNLISEKVYVKNGNIYLKIDGNTPRQITNLGQDTTPILSTDGKKILFLREGEGEGYRAIVRDLENQKDSVVWEDFWLDVAYFDSLHNQVFINGHGPMGCCMHVGVVNIKLKNDETKPICSGHFGKPILSGANKGKFTFIQCGYWEEGGCYEQTWLFDEKLNPVKALDKKHDMEW